MFRMKKKHFKPGNEIWKKALIYTKDLSFCSNNLINNNFPL